MLSALNNLSIGLKVAFSFALVVAIVIGLGLFAIERLGAVDAAAATLRDNRVPSIQQLDKVAMLAERHRANLASVVIAGTDSERASSVAAADRTGQELKAAWAAYSPMIDPGEEQKLAAAFNRSLDDYAAGSTAVIDLAKKGDRAGAAALFVGDLLQRMMRVREAMQTNIDYNTRAGVAESEGGAAVYSSALFWIIGSLIFAIVVSVLAGFAIIRGVAVPITALTGAMRRLAEHDVTSEIVGLGRKDQIGEMAGSVQVFKENMANAAQASATEKVERVAKEQRVARLDVLLRGFEFEGRPAGRAGFIGRHGTGGDGALDVGDRRADHPAGHHRRDCGGGGEFRSADRGRLGRGTQLLDR